MHSIVRIFLLLILGIALLDTAPPPARADGRSDCRGGAGSQAWRAHGGLATHGGHGRSTLRRILMLQRELGMSDEQVARLKALQLDRDRARIRGRADILVAGRELHALLEDESTDLAGIEAKLKQRESLKTALALMLIKSNRDALSLLTPEQREKLNGLVQQVRQRHRDRILSRRESTEPDSVGTAAASDQSGERPAPGPDVQVSLAQH